MGLWFFVAVLIQSNWIGNETIKWSLYLGATISNVKVHGLDGDDMAHSRRGVAVLEEAIAMVMVLRPENDQEIGEFAREW